LVWQIGCSGYSREFLYPFFDIILYLFISYPFFTASKASFLFYLVRSSMSGHEERRVKSRHEVTQYYKRRGVKRTSTHQDLPRGDMTISGDPSPSNSNSGSDDDIEDESYVPSPRACPHGKGVAGPSDSKAARDDEIEEEAKEGADGADDEWRMRPMLWMKSIPPPTCTWELQLFDYLLVWIGERKSATRARQIW
jgi:hypothetical protein